MPRQYTPQVALVCEQCGAPFQVQAHRAKSAHFCSDVCRMTYRGSLTGERAMHFKGGRYEMGGYIWITLPAGGRIQEHRHVMQEHLGRPLQDDEQVHHINRDKRDNRLENLMILSPSEHTRLHMATGKRIHRWSRNHLRCITCGTTERKHASRGLCSLCYRRSRAMSA
jgi:hypothetical protein